MAEMHLRSKRCGALVAVLLMTACEGNYQLVLSYIDQASFDRAQRLELFVSAQTSCEQLRQTPGEVRLAFDPHGTLPELGTLPLGDVAFFARASDANCLAFLDGCHEYELKPRQDTVVRIALLPVVEVGCAAGARCVDRQCLTTDASVGDAAMDARVDAATPDHQIADTTRRDQAVNDTLANDNLANDVVVADTMVRDTATPDAAVADAWTAPDSSAIDGFGGDATRVDAATDAAVGVDQTPACGADFEPCCTSGSPCPQGYCADGWCIGWSTRPLSELRWVSETNGDGPVERDMSVGQAAAGDGTPIVIHGVSYPKGLGVHANSRLLFDLMGANCTRLMADLGIDDWVVNCTSGTSNVEFSVEVNAAVIYASGLVDVNTPTIHLDLDITGAQSLALVVGDYNGDIACDHADWANVRLICPSTVPTYGMVAEFLLDEGSGSTAYDSSGNGNHGTLSGSPTWTAGQIGGALDFHYQDGVDAVVVPDNASTSDVQDGDFTLAGWFNANSIPPATSIDYNDYAYCIVAKAGYHTGLEYSSYSSFEIEHFSVSDDYLGVGSSGSFPTGTWHHVAATVDRAAGETRLYVDGAADGVATWAPGTPSLEYGSLSWHLGTSNIAQSTYRYDADGVVDVVRIYRRALDPGEIAVLAAER